MLFLIFQKEISKKTITSFLGFISMLLLIFEKGISKNLCDYFEIQEYLFLNILKFNKQKTVPSILRLVNMRF